MQITLAIVCIVVSIFVTWFVTRYVYIHRTAEYFTTNFIPGENLEEKIQGYRYKFGDLRPDTFMFFGFDDTARTAFATYLLPRGIHLDPPHRRRK